MTPTSYPAQTGRDTVPTSVVVATLLVWLVIGLFVLRAVLTYALFDSLMDSWYSSREDLQGLPREVAEENWAPEFRGAALASALVVCSGLAASAAFLTRGAGWARIVATIFGVLGVLGGLVGLAQPVTGVFTVLALLSAIAAAAAVVALWLPSSSAFFRSRKRLGPFQ